MEILLVHSFTFRPEKTLTASEVLLTALFGSISPILKHLTEYLRTAQHQPLYSV